MENLIDLEMDGFPSSSKARNGRYQVQYQKCFKEEGGQNAWELSPGVFSHLQGCECTIMWDQLVFIGIYLALRLPYLWLGRELLLSLKHSKALFCLCAPEVIKNGDTCLTSCLGKIPLKQVRFSHEKVEKDFRHCQVQAVNIQSMHLYLTLVRV